jgi:hypothetical protein
LPGGLPKYAYGRLRKGKYKKKPLFFLMLLFNNRFLKATHIMTVMLSWKSLSGAGFLSQ